MDYQVINSNGSIEDQMYGSETYDISLEACTQSLDIPAERVEGDSNIIFLPLLQTDLGRDDIISKKGTGTLIISVFDHNPVSCDNDVTLSVSQQPTQGTTDESTELEGLQMEDLLKLEVSPNTKASTLGTKYVQHMNYNLPFEENLPVDYDQDDFLEAFIQPQQGDNSATENNKEVYMKEGDNSITGNPGCEVHDTNHSAENVTKRPKRNLKENDILADDVPCTHPACTRTFKTKRLLWNHRRCHLEGRFECKNCGKEFSERFKLKRHEVVHTKERLFRCTFIGCGKKFAFPYSLKSHERTHTGVTPYVCPMEGCQKKYTQLGGLKAHLAKHEQST